MTEQETLRLNDYVTEVNKIINDARQNINDRNYGLAFETLSTYIPPFIVNCDDGKKAEGKVTWHEWEEGKDCPRENAQILVLRNKKISFAIGSGSNTFVALEFVNKEGVADTITKTYYFIKGYKWIDVSELIQNKMIDV